MIDALGHYKILSQLGTGGMGDVFRARDTILGRTVIIKVIPRTITADPERRARFLQTHGPRRRCPIRISPRCSK